MKAWNFHTGFVLYRDNHQLCWWKNALASSIERSEMTIINSYKKGLIAIYYLSSGSA